MVDIHCKRMKEINKAYLCVYLRVLVAMGMIVMCHRSGDSHSHAFT